MANLEHEQGAGAGRSAAITVVPGTPVVVAPPGTGASAPPASLEVEVQALRAEAGELRRASRLKDQYLSVATHELSAPLTAMKAYIEALETHWDDPHFTHAHEFLGVLGRELERLIRIVERTLEVSRLTSRGLDVRRQPVDLTAALADIALSIDPILTQNGIALVAQLPDTLPPVLGDRDLVKQVLLNLIHNAIKFSPRGRRVYVQAAEAAEHVLVEVRDEGFGIAPEEIGRIFEPWFRSADDRVERQRGTGLGLTIVKTIVEGHGGTITVESHTDRGTTFRFTLPKA
jgi:signal transduction histidine kinase